MDQSLVLIYCFGLLSVFGNVDFMCSENIFHSRKFRGFKFLTLFLGCSVCYRNISTIFTFTRVEPFLYCFTWQTDVHVVA